MVFDFGIIVTLKVEEEAILGKLEERTVWRLRSGPTFTCGKLAGFQVVVARATAQGSVCSGLAANDLMREFRPSYLVLLGIAAGFPDMVNLGDVVVGDPVIGYEYSKISDGSTEQEPRSFRSSELPLTIIDKLERIVIPNDLDIEHSKAKIGPIASGNKLVASKDFRDRLPHLNRKMCALEMEGEGVAQAAHHSGREFFVIKGISDFADSIKGTRRTKIQKERHDLLQEYASRASVECFIQFLTRCKQEEIIVPKVQDHELLVLKDVSFDPLPADEQEFLRIAKGPSVSLGQLDLQCKLIPPNLWFVNNREDHIYIDDPEQKQRIQLERIDHPLPEKTLGNLIAEMKRVLDDSTKTSQYSRAYIESIEEVYERLSNEGANAYPRLVALPDMLENLDHKLYRVAVGPSRYGMALVEERHLRLPTALNLRTNHVLNSLAVRVAVVYEKEHETWIEFHQRKGSANATYKSAWDVGAAGYIDPQRHVDPEDKLQISPWQACACEIAEELNIHRWDLPNREHYRFFGLARNDLTGQLDLLAVCDLVSKPDPKRFPTARVTAYGRCMLTPESVASFIQEKTYWVPTALLTLILLLELYKFPRPRIEEAFARCVGKVVLEP